MSEPRPLPVLPAAHARALAALRDPELGTAEIAPIVETDPALTAAVLRAANSAASASVSRIATAQQAVTRIGLHATHRLVTGAVVGSSFAHLSEAGLDLDELWRHLVACALLNERLGTRDEERSAAFTAGLMHDIGRMAMANADPKRYSWVVKLASGENRTAADAEQELFGYDHEQLGAELAAEWGLPYEVAAAAGAHHEGGDGLARVTRHSRELAERLGFGDGMRPRAETPPAFDDLPASDRTLLSHLGGAEGLRTQVEWFRENLAAA